jgi:hypothetical protein
MRLLAMAALLLVLAPAGASARTYTANGGGVTATLDYKRASAGPGYLATRLTITRDGTTLFDAKPRPKACSGLTCSPTIEFGKPLRVRDLQGDGEPEVLFTAYTGGAHCCFVAQVYLLGADQAVTSDRNFGDSGYRLRDLDDDGAIELVSNDWRFDYAFTAYAFSGKPVQIFHVDGGRFADVTRSFPDQIRRDARLWRRSYHKTRHRQDGTQYGPLAAWAADRYLLGQRDAMLRFLKSEGRRGLLQPRGMRFVGRLDGFLLRNGYG